MPDPHASGPPPTLTGLPPEVLAGLLGQAGDALGVVTRDGTLRPANAAAQRFLERMSACAAAPVRGLLDLPLEEDDRDAIRAFLGDGEPALDAVFRIAPGGAEQYWRIVLRWSEPAGGFVAALRDETVLRDAMARVLRLERLRQAGALAAGLLHDLNNLLAAALGFADHMAEQTQDPEQRAFLETFLRDSKAGAQLLQRVHGMLRPGRPRWERVAVHETVELAVRMARKAAALGGVTVVAELPPESPWVRGTREDLAQSVLHLILLGRMACSPGSTVRVEVARESRALVAGARARPWAVVRVIHPGPDTLGRQVAAVLADPEAGILEVLQRLTGDVTGFLWSFLSVLWLGGRVLNEPPRAGASVWSLWLPRAAAAGPRA